MGISPIRLGSYHKKEVFCDLDSALNQHVILLGDTGCGKSVQGQNIATELVKQGRTVLILDHHSVASENQIFSAYEMEFKRHLHNIDVYENGISCPLFSPIIFPDGGMEKPVDTVGAILDVLSRTMKFGTKQQAVLRRALNYVLETGSYETEGLAALEQALVKSSTVVAETVREKLYPFTVRNVFRPGELDIKPGKINVIRLSKLDLATQTIVAEILLAYLWRLAVTFQFEEDPLFIFVDEFQNLPLGKGCALGQILSEGRKFGINLILMTQQMPVQTSSMFQQQLMQCGLSLFFRPNKAQTGTIARLINPVNPDEWMLVLRTLGRGEFVAVGPLIVEGCLTERPLKLSALEDEPELSEIPHGRGTVKMR